MSYNISNTKIAPAIYTYATKLFMGLVALVEMKG